MLHGKRFQPAVLLIFIAIALLLGLVRPARGLDHSGTLAADETWFAADNPHMIVANVTVAVGVTLTLEAGVEVRFVGNRSISTRGTLSAIGTLAQPIVFTPDGTSNWSSISLAGSGQITMSHVEMDHAIYGVYSTSSGQIDLDQVDIRDCTYGLYVTNGSLDLSSVTVSDCASYGLYSQGVMPSFLDGDCEFTGNATGVRIDDVALANLGDPVTIAGSSVAGLSLVDCDNVVIDNLTLLGNDATDGAILLDDSGDCLLGSGNVIGGPGVENSWPVTLRAGSYLAAGSAIPTTGNLENAIRVAGGSSTRSGTWRRFPDLDYVVATNSTVSAGGMLTIDPGVTVRLSNNRALAFGGELSAVGTAGQPIQFVRGGTSTWSGLSFNGGGGATLEHCVIDGASYGLYVNSTGTFDLSHGRLTGCTYGVYAINTADLTVTHCQIDSNGRGIFSIAAALSLGSVDFVGNTHTGLYVSGVMPTWLDDGIVFDGNDIGCHLEDIAGVSLVEPFLFQDNTEVGLWLEGCEAPSVDNQTFVSNTGTHGAMYVLDCGNFTLGAGNVIGGAGQENSWPLAVGAGAYPAPASVIPTSGNARDDIRVSGGQSDRSGTWPSFAGLDYVLMTNTTIQAGGEHILAPGVTVRLNNSRQFVVAGQFTAVGSPGQEILLTREGASAWSGLSFNGGGGATLEHCVLDGATYGLYVNSTGAIDLDECRIANCSYGLYAANAPQVSAVSCTFENNNFGMATINGTLELGSCDFVGNASTGLRCAGVVPTILDTDLVFDANATGLQIEDVAGLSLTTPVTFTANTAAGLVLDGCDAPTLDNLVFTGNIGDDGALVLVDCGEVQINAGNVIGGVGQENSWPLSLGPGAYPTATSVLPASGNLNNGIRVRGGTSARTGRWRLFPGLDYVVEANHTISAAGSLTIDAGNTVRFNSSRQITVQGELILDGASGNEVQCVANGASNWTGLSFSGGSNGALRHATVTGAAYGVYYNSTGHLDLEGANLTANSYGIYAVGEGSIQLVNSRITNNTSYGIYRTNSELVFGADLSQWNDIHGNGTGQDGRDFRNNEDDILAPFVYWGTMDWSAIEDHIHDVLDDEDLGRVGYVPYASEDHLSVVVGVETDDDDIPSVFGVSQNYPNPFNPTTTISLDLPRATKVRLRLYDLRGALVATLVDGPMPAGRHPVVWHGQDDRGRPMASGVYSYRVEAGDEQATRTMMLVR